MQMNVPAPSLRRNAAITLMVLAALSLTGCQLPRSGPMLSEMTGAHDDKDVIVMPASRELVQESRVPDVADFPVRYRDLTEAGFDRLVPGDGINVKVWERGGLGVFAADPSGVSDLGNQQIDRSGNVYFPIIGKFQAGGLTLAQLHDRVVQRLAKLVVGADVSVTRAAAERGQMVTVQGNLTKPGMYPITQTSQRLSSALAQAAPVQTNPEQLVISLRRDNQVASVRLSDIYRNQNNDILLRPGDVITAYDSREYLTVLGAAGTQGRVAISKRNYSVLDALADSRGLDDKLADPRSVFLFTPAKAGVEGKPDMLPVVYQFDLTRPEQVALAREFTVHEGQAIYISDAPFTQVQKVLSAFRVTMSAGFSATRAIDSDSGGSSTGVTQ
ncbi:MULTISPECIES: polysaccharide biosynthesis/export family protein [Achromobacter]|uniref:Polysaccharide biosynthesis/export family protein n=1 Tax=Achromobacter spanius TaxID=217203 RepID=A0ABY8GQH9_9BURK|nr:MULTISPECIES: polysaccharide biosynthesis/export family protein [Achromobacter]WAI83928.1 polysaccharide biosynthesis/export family protein [Achromobacter spanius]WEX94009.1 polysaccharide biosynthesis/export family protein [Achromobacter sp. SS2-2022]WFP06828.1 polysaccharide biosynthesis/export family protein [Achromobacter spanius]